MAVVDHDGAALDGLGQQFLRDIVAGGSEHNVAALKGLGASLFDHDLLAADLDGFARRARARQQLELADRELLLVEALEHLGAHGSRRAQNSNRVLFHASPFKGFGFCPHAEQADYCSQCIQERGRHETRLLVERSQSGIDRRGSLQVGDLHNAVLIGEGTVNGLDRQIEVLLLHTDDNVDLVTAL